MKTLEEYIDVIPDFPTEGVMFRDITSVIQDPDGFRLAIDSLMEHLEGVDFDIIIGLESRGFIFGAPIAYEMNKSLVLVRKKGKLPKETIAEEYSLEYGSATIEIHKDSILPGQKVVIIDDVIATGGTVKAAANLVERLGGKVVRILSLMELKGLNGRDILSGYDVDVLISYEGK
ncbi:MAG: adenine phosphoribosyltransferase [Clostridiales bacterium]|nr:adenine phosphoribosyltransferase [Clostridiales bacterium]